MDSTRSIANSGSNAHDQARPFGAPAIQLGDFELGPEIGRGGMGVVYLANEKGLDRKVALKVLPWNDRISSLHVKRFLAEARAAAQLSHDNIVPIYHIGEDSGTHYFAMKLIEGKDLSEVIRRARHSVATVRNPLVTTQTRLPHSENSRQEADQNRDSADSETDLSGFSFASGLHSKDSKHANKLATHVAKIGQAVAEALHHAHQHGIIHRDIKPSNLMLDTNNKVWVTDFGLAQLQDAPALTNTGDIVGTLRYMSPEQASGRRTFVDHRTDVYSIGVTLYELATLHHACRGETAREILRSVTFERPMPVRKINPRLPRDFETIICKAIERNPCDRYQTAADLAEDLRRFANNESLVARRMSCIKKMRDWFSLRPLFTMSLATSVIILLALISFAAANLRNDLVIEREKLTKIQGRLAQSMSMLYRDENPGYALALAREGAKAAPGFAANRTLLSSADGIYEIQTELLNGLPPGRLVASPDGDQLLLCSNPKSFDEGTAPVPVFDLKSRKRSFMSNDSPITEAGFSHDGRFILTSGSSLARTGNLAFEDIRFSTVSIWDAKKFERLKLFPNSRPLSLSVANFSPTSHRLILPNRNNSVSIYESNGWNQVMDLNGQHQGPVLQCEYSPDGTKIATWSLDSTLIVWDSSSGRLLQKFSYPSIRPLRVSFKFLSSSKQILLQGEQGIHLYSLEDEIAPHFRPESYAKVGTFTDRIFILSMDRKKIFIVSPKTWRVVGQCESKHSIDRFVLFDRDQFIAAVDDQSIELFDTQDGAYVAALRGHEDTIFDIVARPLHGQVQSVSWDGTLRVWNAYSNLESRTFSTRIEPSSIPQIGFSSDGHRALLGSVTGWESSIRNVGMIAQSVASVRGDLKAVLDDGRLLTSELGSVMVWDPSTLKKIASVKVPGLAVTAAYPLLDNNKVILFTQDGKLLHWDFETEEIEILTNMGEHVNAVAIDSRAGRLFAGLSTGHLLSIDCRTLDRSVVNDFGKPIVCLDFDRDTSAVLVSVQDYGVVVWGLQENAVKATLIDSGMVVTEARFARGSEFVVAHGGRMTKHIALWNIENQSLVSKIDVDPIRDYDLSDDRQQFAFATRSGAFIWDMVLNEKYSVIERPTLHVCFVSDKLIVSNESRLADGSLHGTNARKIVESQIVVWDFAGRKIDSSHVIGLNVTAIQAYSALGHFVVSTKAYGADVVDLETTQKIATILGHAHPLAFVAFAPDDNTVLGVSSSGRIMLNNIDLTEFTELGKHEFQLLSASLSPDRKQLLTADVRGNIFQWDLIGRKFVRSLQSDTPALQLLIGMSSNMAFGLFQPDIIKKWDLRSGDPTEIRIPGGVRSIRLSPDEESLLAVTGTTDLIASPTRAIAQLDVKDVNQADAVFINLKLKKNQIIRIDGDAISGEFLNSGKHFALLSTKGIIHVFDAQTLQLFKTLDSSPKLLRLLISSGTDTVFAAASGRISAWESKSGMQILDLPMPNLAAQVHLKMSQWIITSPNSHWYLLPAGDVVSKCPKIPLAYVEKILPRELTLDERNRLFLGEMNEGQN